MSISRGDRLAGGVWGHLIGDAVGVPYEFGPAVPAEKVVWRGHGAHNQPAGTWSDDGALMLALLDSLLEKGFDTADQGERSLAWYREGRYTPDGKRFDVGNATAAALHRFEPGTPAEECGLPDAAGNGSLMRILPLALVERNASDEELVSRAHRASRVTHGDVRAHVACALYVLVARALLRGELGRSDVLESATNRLRKLYASAEFEDKFGEALDFLLAYSERGGRGRAWDSFWSAWDAFAGAESATCDPARARRRPGGGLRAGDDHRGVAPTRPTS
ncbi:MAG TPA: ADP-ribosylglycohydrolase family protein [Candidatus Limnocylindrales bacterium]